MSSCTYTYPEVKNAEKIDYEYIKKECRITVPFSDQYEFLDRKDQIMNVVTCLFGDSLGKNNGFGYVPTRDQLTTWNTMLAVVSKDYGIDAPILEVGLSYDSIMIQPRTNGKKKSIREFVAAMLIYVYKFKVSMISSTDDITQIVAINDLIKNHPMGVKHDYKGEIVEKVI